MNKKIIPTLFYCCIVIKTELMITSWSNIQAAMNNKHDEFAQQLQDNIDSRKITIKNPETPEEFQYLNYLDNEQITLTQSSIDQKKFIESYINNVDGLIQDTHDFWADHTNYIINLLELKEQSINSDGYEIISQACNLGNSLDTYQILELFDSHYNILDAVVQKITWRDHENIIPQPELLKLQKTTQSLVSSLLEQEYIRKKYQHKQSQQNELKEITIQEHTTRLEHTLSEKNNASLHRIHKNESIDRSNKNLKNYESISDVRGEGNCGYRAFLGSVCMNGIAFNNVQGIEQLQRLTENQFEPLFLKYAGENNHPLKLSVMETKLTLTLDTIKNIKSSLLRNIERIKVACTFDDVAEIFNTHTEFDFYMIMFLRTLISEKLLHNENLRNLAIITRGYELDTEFDTEKTQEYLNKQLEFGTWIDHPELQALNEATEIHIHLINEEAVFNHDVHFLHQSIETQEALRADILFSAGNHYKIIHPKIKHQRREI